MRKGNLALLGVGLLDHAQIRVRAETYFAHDGEVSPALEAIRRCGGLHHPAGCRALVVNGKSPRWQLCRVLQKVNLVTFEVKVKMTVKICKREDLESISRFLY